jgi:cytochrome c-type biogenesis protein
VLLGGFLLGASLDIVWKPCSGPILASIVLVVAQLGTMFYGGVLLFAYSMSLGVPRLAIAYSSSFISGKVRLFAKHTMMMRKVAGIVLIVVGIYYLSGVTGLSLPLLS